MAFDVQASDYPLVTSSACLTAVDEDDCEGEDEIAIILQALGELQTMINPAYYEEGLSRVAQLRQLCASGVSEDDDEYQSTLIMTGLSELESYIDPQYASPARDIVQAMTSLYL